MAQWRQWRRRAVPLGSLLIDTVDWRWVFFVNVPVALIAWLRGRRILEESRDPSATARPDILGVVLLIIDMGALALAIRHAWTFSLVTSLATAFISLALGRTAVLSHRMPVTPVAA